jgi:hypothetical protein
MTILLCYVLIFLLYLQVFSDVLNHFSCLPLSQMIFQVFLFLVLIFIFSQQFKLNRHKFQEYNKIWIPIVIFFVITYVLPPDTLPV